MGNILLIEDEIGIARSLELPLRQTYGHSLTHCLTLEDALHTWDKGSFDAVLLDLNLPDGNGIDFCRAVRKSRDTTPILILTARRDEVDRILGLELGADDYIVKPFSPREVGARINAVLRRRNWDMQSENDSLIKHCGIVINENRREVSVHGRLISLTRTEYRLLSALMKRPGWVFTRDNLVDLVWDGNFVTDRVVDSVVSRLRRKLGRMSSGEKWIRTVHGTGYAMADCP